MITEEKVKTPIEERLIEKFEQLNADDRTRLKIGRDIVIDTDWGEDLLRAYAIYADRTVAYAQAMATGNQGDPEVEAAKTDKNAAREPLIEAIRAMNEEGYSGLEIRRFANTIEGAAKHVAEDITNERLREGWDALRVQLPSFSKIVENAQIFLGHRQRFYSVDKMIAADGRPQDDGVRRF